MNKLCVLIFISFLFGNYSFAHSALKNKTETKSDIMDFRLEAIDQRLALISLNLAGAAISVDDLASARVYDHLQDAVERLEYEYEDVKKSPTKMGIKALEDRVSKLERLVTSYSNILKVY